MIAKPQTKSFQLKMQAIQLATANTCIPPLALKVFTRLVDHHNMKTGQCNPSNGTLARALGASERGVRSAIRQLEKQGLIETRPGGGRHRCNSYIIPALNTRQTRNAPTRNPERMVSNNRNAPSPETIKETIKKRRGENTANKPGEISSVFSDANTEKEAAKEQGKIEKLLLAMLGNNGWEILMAQSELCEEMYKQIANKEISLEQAVCRLIEGQQNC